MGKMDKVFEESKKHLDQDEEVLNWITASYGTSTGVLLATNKRAVFYGKKLFGFNLETIPYSKISSIDVNKEMNHYHVRLFTSGNEIKVMSVSKHTIEFVSDIRKHIA